MSVLPCEGVEYEWFTLHALGHRDDTAISVEMEQTDSPEDMGEAHGRGVHRPCRP